MLKHGKKNRSGVRQIHIKFIAMVILPFVFVTPGTSGQVHRQSDDTLAQNNHVPDEIIIKFKPDIPAEIKNEIIGMYRCTVVGKCSFPDLQLLKTAEPEQAEQMLSMYQNHDEVEYAELNHYFRQFLIPNDELYSYQWNFYNDTYGGVHIEAAWDIHTGDPNIVIAVLDSGIAYEDFGIFRLAPDLARTRFVSGYDFVNNDAHPNDDNGHGTHVTGTIAQATNNGIGVAGVAFNCSIMPVKVMNSEGTGTTFDIADGIYYATNNGAKVLNMSIGTDFDTRTIREAVEYAYNSNVTIVCAMGNDFEQGNPTSYPAAYDDYCIAVGATRFDQNRAYYSNTGNHIDIAAPGGDNRVDQNGDGSPDGILQQTFDDDPGVFAYYFAEGTSAATPHVSGAAALLISNGVTDPAMVREALEQTAEDLGPRGWDTQYGWGLLDIEAALNYFDTSAVVTGDINGDSTVNFDDIVLLAEQWQWLAVTPLTTDINGDRIVNFKDFALLAQNWKKFPP
ncbi:MAG: S8 family serine peptidase [Sedimentisphaerales bacterium]|nr:S8 family serine peptidase [Sedimentisphaerales bacterium]